MAGEFTTEQLRAMMMEVLGKGSGGPGPGADESATLAYYKKLNAELKDSTTKTQLFTKFLKGGTSELANFQEKISKLDDEIKKMSESQSKRNLIAERDELKAAAARAQSTDANLKFVKSVGSAAAAASGKFVTSLQGGSSGFALATDVMSLAVDATSGVAQMAGNAIGVAGVAASRLPGPLGMVAKAAAVLGPLFGSMAGVAGKLAKFGFEVLQKEVEKSVAAYNSAAASGALFAGGMTELRNSASRAGLDVSQFANVLRQHSNDIASLGIGMTEGAKRIGGVLTTNGDTMKRQLVNMGFSFEEQAGLVAETMSIMKGSTLGPMQASDAQIADQTMKYAENLRIISAITGEDAKKKMEGVRQQANQLAFQQKLAAKSPEQQAAIIRAMGNMDAVARKNFMDMVNFGSVINKEGAMMQSMSGGLADEVNQTYRSFMDGTMDDTTQRKIASDNADQRKKDLIAATAIGIAGAANVGGPAQALSEAMGIALQGLNKTTPESIAAGEASVAAAKNTTDSFSDVAIAAQDFRLVLQDALTPAIKQFATVSKAMLGDVHSMLESIGISKNGNVDNINFGKMSKVDKVMSGTARGVETVGSAADMMSFGAVNAVLGWFGTSIDQVKSERIARESAYLSSSGKANGGIASGPASGFLEKLHGTEAVVPLPDGKTIPVAITSPLDSVSPSVSSASDTSSNMMRDLLSRQLDLMQKTFDQTTEMLSSFNDSKQLQQQLVHNSY